MRSFTKYNPVTGLIEGAGHCQSAVFYIEKNIIAGIYDDSLFYVKDGVAKLLPYKPSIFHSWDLPTESWTLSSEAIEEARSKKSVSLDADCKQSIVSGFYSSALGVEHFYPSKETDQANLNASVTSSFYPNLPEDWATPFWCSLDGDWQYVEHTAEQIQQVGLDGKTAILGYLAKNQALHTQLQQAETLEEVEVIQW